MPIEIIDIIYLIFAFVVLYFAVLFLLLYLEHKKLTPEQFILKTFPKITILIPAYNEEKTIAGTIKTVKKLDYPKELLEIIIIDDGSTDKTKQIASSFNGIKVLSKKNQQRKAYALNYGLKHATGKLIACIDADSYPNKDSLMKSIGFFEDPEVGAVTGSVFVRSPSSLLERLQNIEYTLIVWSRKLLEILDGIYVTPGALSLYRKSALDKIGKFDTKNMTEDIEITWRLIYHKYKIKMALDSKVYTGVPTSFKEWWSQRIRWSMGGIQTTLKYLHVFLKKDFKSLGMFIMPFFTFSYLFSIIGFLIFVFLMMRGIFNFLYFTMNSYLLGVDPIQHYALFDYILLPNIFVIFGLLILLLSLIWVKVSYNKTKSKLGGLGGLLDLLIYLSLFITLFPIILIHSIIKLLRKDYTW